MNIQSVTTVLQNSRGEVLICKRSPKVSYFPNAWVFPGGKLEVPISNWTGEEDYVVDTALQEIFEETGIILGNRRTSQTREGSWKDQVEDIVKTETLVSRLRFAGRRQTPPFDKGIFDTSYFYLQDGYFDEIRCEGDGSEIVAIEWVRPEDAIVQFSKGERNYPPPVLYTFRLLSEFGESFPDEGRKHTDLPPGIQTPVEFAPDYFVIPLPAHTAHPFTSTNLGIIRGSESVLFIDPGWNTSCEWADELIRRYSAERVYVFLTHHHHDHWDGLRTLALVYPKAEIIGHPETLDKVKTDLQVIETTSYVIDLGGREVEFISAPGHTSGHMIALDRLTGIVYGGDHVVGRGTALLDPRTGSMKQYLETLDLIEKLSPRMLIPSHGRPNYRPLRMIERYRKHRLEREQQIFLLLNGGRTIEEILITVYKDVPQKLWKYARYNIALHLQKLIEEGKVVEENELYLSKVDSNPN